MAREAPAPAPAAAKPPADAPGTVEVCFLRRWRGYERGDRANFVPSIARDLVAVGYGAAAGMTASPTRTLMVRK